MSFIITVYTHEGIVMASDSRITYTTYEPNPNGKGALKNYGIQSTDTTYKTFMCNSTIGLSAAGASSIKNKPISIYIEDFINKHVKEKSTVEEISQKLIDYFGKFDPEETADAFYIRFYFPRMRAFAFLLRQQLNGISEALPSVEWVDKLGCEVES